ncbi:MAG: hypothetical protein LBD15_04510 [Holosporales bacterium]|jgi:hypothetical protein|nr:hypothetical protein [Holosporales bacterium]
MEFKTMGTIVHLDDYRHNKVKWAKQNSGVPKKQEKKQTPAMKPLGRRKFSYPDLQKQRGQEDLSDSS